MIKNVLIVDDDKEMLLALKEGFKRYQESFTVLLAEDGLKALDSLKANVVSLVVTGLKMPQMDGVETLREIKKRYPIIEVIMLTGHANVEVAIQGMELGAFDYLLKPIKIDQLLYKIQDAYKKKSLTDQKIIRKKETFGMAE